MNDESLLFDFDAERALLGSVLVTPTAFDEVAGIISVRSFHDLRHAVIFQTAQDWISQNGPTGIDAVTLAYELERRGQLKEAGGALYVGQIVEVVPHGAHARYYAEIVREKANRRELHGIAYELKNAIGDPGRETETIISETEQRLHGLMESSPENESLVIGDVLLEMSEATEPNNTVSTGFTDLDDLLDGGLVGGWLVILAARPSMGKTAFVGNIALNAANKGESCLIFSLEQTRRGIAERFLASLSGVDTSLFKTKNQHLQSEADKSQILKAQNKLSRYPIRVNDKAGLRIGQIATEARLRKRRDGLGLIMVDYLQLIEPDDRKIPREQQVATISRQLKLLAKDLDVPVICLAQLNRAVEARDNKRPRLSDLRESGAIEQDADVVMFLDRPPVYVEKADDPSEATLIIRKNRDGKTGDVSLHWDGSTVSFRNAAPKYQSAWPDEE